jgi:hypothetical protein
MIESSAKIKFALGLLFNFYIHFFSFSQGVLVDRKPSVLPNEVPVQIVDPARYHSIQIIDIKVGQLYADDRGFNRLLKYQGLKPGKQTFYDVGLNYNYLIKKLNLGLKADFSFQNTESSPALNHVAWQAIIGYSVKRRDKTIITLNGNLGVQTSTIRFGYTPPVFLSQVNVVHSSSKLFQKEFVIGPTFNINKFFNKTRSYQGFSLGLEAGVNFAPFKSAWKYGYTDNDDLFVGEEITDMPKAARQTYFTSLKFGFWSAK